MKRFETEKSEDARSRRKRWQFNFFPAYRRTGARISFISADWKEVHVRLRLKWTTRNYVGTVFGGSIYGALDPIYMLQLIQLLGKGYVVWDKQATVRFVRPIKTEVYARFLITDELLAEIKDRVEKDREMEIELPVRFTDKAGKVYAEVNKMIYVANAEYYKQKRSERKRKRSN